MSREGFSAQKGFPLTCEMSHLPCVRLIWAILVARLPRAKSNAQLIEVHETVPRDILCRPGIQANTAGAAQTRGSAGTARPVWSPSSALPQGNAVPTATGL